MEIEMNENYNKEEEIIYSESKYEKLFDKKELKEKRKNRIEKDQRKIRELVFDEKTIENIFKLQTKGYIGELIKVISTGKEANVYLARAPIDPNNPEIDPGFRAVKIYKIETTKFKSFNDYLIWDPRFKFIKTDNLRKLISYWCKKEYANLLDAYAIGINVPRPFAYLDNVIVMDFIGDKNGNPSMKLKEYIKYNSLKDPEKFMDTVYEYMLKLKNEANLVHADLSEYNILVKEEKPVFIDMAQSVKKGHPRFEEFWQRDLKNINNFCKKIGLNKEYGKEK